MRVAYSIDSLGGGGSELSLAETLPHLVTAGIEPRVFVLSEPRQGFADLVRGRGIPVDLLTGRGWPGRVRDLRRRLMRWKPDLLHTSLFYSDVTGRLAAARTGIPVLSSLVSMGYVPRRRDDPRISRWKLGAVRHIDGWTARHLTDRFHAVSEAAKASAVRWQRIAPEHITVIRRGRDTERLGAPSPERRLAARRAWGVSEGQTLLVNVGRHVFQKGQDVLLEAFSELDRTGRDLRLVIAGSEGASTRELRRLIDSRGLAGRVELAGFVADVPELLAAADLFVLPSRLEGMPGAVIEAMALALPVVASDIPTLREIFPAGEGALLFEEGSATELAAAIGRLLDDDELRATFSRATRSAFLERFEVRSTIPSFLSLYREVAECG